MRIQSRERCRYKRSRLQVACPTCRCFVGQLSSKRALFDYGKTKHVRADCYDTMCERADVHGACA